MIERVVSAKFNEVITRVDGFVFLVRFARFGIEEVLVHDFTLGCCTENVRFFFH